MLLKFAWIYNGELLKNIFNSAYVHIYVSKILFS